VGSGVFAGVGVAESVGVVDEKPEKMSEGLIFMTS
jgi:hypothetical protein